MRQKGWIGGTPRRAIAVVDIGTSKVACLIAAVEPENGKTASDATRPNIHLLGFGHQRAQGIKAGVITDIDQAEQAVRAAIAQAESMAGVMLEEVRVSVSCGRLKSHRFTANADIEDGVISESDFARVLNAGREYAERDGGTLLGLNTVAIRLDDISGAIDPRGLAARHMAADLHAVTADEPPLRNLMLTVERCYVAASGLTPAPLASALATTTHEERALGVTAIDIGAGTATLAMFAEGRFLHTAAFPMAGDQVTLDIARALHTPLPEAERIKALYGTVVSAPSDEHDVIAYPSSDSDEEATQRITKAELAETIRPRLRAILGELRECIERCDVARYADGRVVLTGGTSQLAGLADFAANELGRPVRIARPQAVTGLPANVSNPAFSTSVGLLLAEMPEFEGLMGFQADQPTPTSYLHRVGSWLKESF